MSSPLFEKADEHLHHEKINLEKSRDVRKIAAQTRGGYACSVKLMDWRARDIYKYNPRNEASKFENFMLEENEQLIGVYGCKDQLKWFNCFGFIVRVTKD